MRALVVEDDQAIRTLVLRLLARAGFETDAAADGRLGIELLDQHTYQLIVLDLMMPHVDGFAVLRHAAEHHRESLRRVVVITAMSEAVLRRRFDLDVCKVITKPFDIAVFLESIRDCAEAA